MIKSYKELQKWSYRLHTKVNTFIFGIEAIWLDHWKLLDPWEGSHQKMFAIWLVKEYKNAILNIESISTNWISSFLSLFVISTLYMYNQHSIYMNRLLRYSEDILSHESVLPRCFSANLGLIHIFNTKRSTLTMVFEGNRWDLKYE